MSRNFDLMTQIEIELREASKRPQVAVDHFVVMPVAPDETSNVFREETLRLVQRIFLSTEENAPRQVVFCGVDDENGSSSVCACSGRTLAVNCTQSVCLVDANIRSPRLSDIFGVNTTTPFSGTSASLLSQCVKLGSNLWLAGPDILADRNRVLMPLDDLKKRLAELRNAFGYVLIDTPGTNVCGDAQLLGQVADAAILIIEANGTRRLTARRAKETLEAAGVRLLGTVMYNRSFPIPAGLYKRL